MNFRQFSRNFRTPAEFVKFAHYIAGNMEEKGGVKNPVVKMEIWKSVNERRPKLLNDTTLNYANVPYTYSGVPSWILPWSSAEEEPQFNEDKYHHWQEFLKKSKQNRKMQVP
jgi:hypothetical protein